MRFDVVEPILPELRIRLTHSLKKYRKVVIKHDPEYEAAGERADAETTFIDGEGAIIVYMTPNIDHTAAQDAALLAHEAVHAALFYFAMIGEEEPGEEEIAYMVENITQYLVSEHFRWKKRKIEKEQ